jgi:hypothetical protein
LLDYTGRDVCRMIHSNETRWHELVPEVAWPMAARHARLTGSCGAGSLEGSRPSWPHEDARTS